MVNPWGVCLAVRAVQQSTGQHSRRQGERGRRRHTRQKQQWHHQRARGEAAAGHRGRQPSKLLLRAPPRVRLIRPYSYLIQYERATSWSGKSEAADQPPSTLLNHKIPVCRGLRGSQCCAGRDHGGIGVRWWATGRQALPDKGRVAHDVLFLVAVCEQANACWSVKHNHDWSS